MVAPVAAALILFMFPGVAHSGATLEALQESCETSLLQTSSRSGRAGNHTRVLEFISVATEKVETPNRDKELCHSRRRMNFFDGRQPTPKELDLCDCSLIEDCTRCTFRRGEMCKDVCHDYKRCVDATDREKPFVLRDAYDSPYGTKQIFCGLYDYKKGSYQTCPVVPIAGSESIGNNKNPAMRGAQWDWLWQAARTWGPHQHCERKPAWGKFKGRGYDCHNKVCLGWSKLDGDGEDRYKVNSYCGKRKECNTGYCPKLLKDTCFDRGDCVMFVNPKCERSQDHLHIQHRRLTTTGLRFAKTLTGTLCSKDYQWHDVSGALEKWPTFVGQFPVRQMPVKWAEAKLFEHFPNVFSQVEERFERMVDSAPSKLAISVWRAPRCDNKTQYMVLMTQVVIGKIGSYYGSKYESIMVN